MHMTKTTRVISFLILASVLLHPCNLTAFPSHDTAPLPGKKLVVGILHDPPYIIKGTDGEWTGINIDIWRRVAQSIKAEYEFKEMKFQEQLDALKNGEIDISIESFYVMAEKEQYMDFSFPFGNARLALATLPEKIHHPWWAAIHIFLSWGNLKIIASLGLVLCLLGFLFWLIERKDNPDHFGGGLVKGVGTGIYWVGSTLASGVCFGIPLKSLTARILGVIWMLSCAIALSALIASLTSTLNANRLAVDLVNDETLRHMHLGGIKGSAESLTLKHIGGKYTLYPDEDIVHNALINRRIEGVLYDEITLNYYKNNDYKGRITTYPTNFKRFFFAFGLPKKSPIRDKMNYALLTLMEGSDWPYLLKRYGLEENFEEKQAPSIKRGKISY